MCYVIAATIPTNPRIVPFAFLCLFCSVSFFDLGALVVMVCHQLT